MQEFLFPHDVRGWLTESEGMALAEAARGKVVLEIGSYCGRSTICMAQTAHRVHAVDWHKGDAGSGFSDTKEEFEANLKRFNVADKVIGYYVRSEQAQVQEQVDFAFIDGAHDTASVKADIAVAFKYLKPGGQLAFHDCDYDSVQKAITETLGAGDGRVVDRVYFRSMATIPKIDKVFVSIPTRGTLQPGTMVATHQAGTTPVYAIRTHSCSLLTLSFNKMWCMALNERDHFSHFFMMHDDLYPVEGGWLDVMLGELKKSGADILSAVIPIKDERGYTSTAFWDRKKNTMRRLTMTEAFQLPPTFSAAQAGFPGCAILPNTGFWICDFTKPWVEKICFTILDKNFKDKNGLWTTQCFSEDWHFGVQAAILGLKVCATTAVKLIHKGVFDYPNFTPWGSCKTDDAVGSLDYPPRADLMPEPLWEEKVQKSQELALA